MTWLQLAWANLRHAPLTSAVNAALMALGTASIVLLLLTGEQFARVISRDAQGIDLVLGAKGSPVQLVLSSVYHADIPTGNIPLSEANQWAEDRRVASAIPLSLGDSYRGFRIVGTTPEYADLYAAKLTHGQFWDAPLQAVLGAAVAADTGLSVGGEFSGAHGLSQGGDAHDEHAYLVVGTLQATGTVLDRLILTSLDSVWDLHGEGGDHAHGHDEHIEEPKYDADHEKADERHVGEDHEHEVHHDEHDSDHNHNHNHEAAEAHEHRTEHRDITAMLISYATPMAAISLPREINSASQLQAASPAFELSRMLNLVGLGLDGLRAFAGVLLLTAGFSIFAALYGALQSRRFDLAMLRCLGATRLELMLCLLLEGLLLTVLGVILGFALGHGAMAALGAWLQASKGVVISGWIWLPQETVLLAALLGIGLLAAALPAWRAYRNDVAQTLAER